MHESEKWKWSHSVLSDSQRPHGLQPTRLLRPRDFPGKSTGVGCHCLLQLNVYIILNTLGRSEKFCQFPKWFSKHNLEQLPTWQELIGFSSEFFTFKASDWQMIAMAPGSIFLLFPYSSVGKESTCNVGDLGSIPRLGGSSAEGNGNPLHYSCLGNPMDKEPDKLVYGIANSQTQLRN